MPTTAESITLRLPDELREGLVTLATQQDRSVGAELREDARRHFGELGTASTPPARGVGRRNGTH